MRVRSDVPMLFCITYSGAERCAEKTEDKRALYLELGKTDVSTVHGKRQMMYANEGERSDTIYLLIVNTSYGDYEVSRVIIIMAATERETWKGVDNTVPTCSICPNCPNSSCSSAVVHEKVKLRTNRRAVERIVCRVASCGSRGSHDTSSGY